VTFNLPIFVLLLLTVGWFLPQTSPANGSFSYVEQKPGPGSFCIARDGGVAGVFVGAEDFPGVIRAAGDLRKDIGKVTGGTPGLVCGEMPGGTNVIIIGTIGKSPVIDRLVRDKKIDPSPIIGKWESYLIQVVTNPFPDMPQALVIMGSDKRGTIYGIYDLSESIGVSPWYYWADVPAWHHAELYVKSGNFVQGPPAVKYRGIFLNDEAPDLSNWIAMNYGSVPKGTNPPVPPGVPSYNHAFYTNLFELILRLKGNYLWPAMWNNAFNEDDTNNPLLADEYGVVMGTSHQEPMLRAQQEWDRRYLKTLGTWNYAREPDVLQDFWREGIRRNRHYESIITLGLRGANDTPMAPGGPKANLKLLDQIVAVQRKIIEEEEDPKIAPMTQVWCLYKEVMDYYNAGMRVPDDVTLLWAEDNWGNVRRLPTVAERYRSGGSGVYYHFDYHGTPRNYQWLNTSPISKIWDQMSLADEYGADRIWIVNVGHFKGYEFPLEYFMSLAWNPQRWTNTNLHEFTLDWAAREFGPQFATDIADIITRYTRYNGRRKPELLAPDTYSLVNYREAETVAGDYDAIAARARNIAGQLPVERRDAFYELVQFPVDAGALLNELYLAANKNALYAQQGRASANVFAVRTRELFAADTNLMAYYNQTFAGGKWNHFMDQAHLGYTNWCDSPQNSLRAVPLREIVVPPAAAPGLAVEGSTSAWPGASNDSVLPPFDSLTRQSHYFEIFNRGQAPYDFTVTASEPWILLSETNGTVGADLRLWVGVDWNRVPWGETSGIINVSATTNQFRIVLNVFNPVEPTRASLEGFVEGEGFVCVEPEHFTRARDAGASRWLRIEDYGRTLSGMRATGPVDLPVVTLVKDAPVLEYQMFLFHTGAVQVATITSPTLNFLPGHGLRLGVSFDDDPPQILTLVPAGYKAQSGNMDWERVVADNARYVYSNHMIKQPGYHILKYWMVDPGVVLQKIVVNLGGLKPSYLGPPESFWHEIHPP
jgi:hypothetical protein